MILRTANISSEREGRKLQRGNLYQMGWIQSASTVVLVVVLIFSPSNFFHLGWRGKHRVCIAQMYCLWPFSPFLYLAQLTWCFRNTRAHKTCLSFSRPTFISLCEAEDTLKTRIWVLFLANLTVRVRKAFSCLEEVQCFLWVQSLEQTWGLQTSESTWNMTSGI